jgi:hypothetical protein
LVEEPEEHWIDLILDQLLTLIEVEIIFDEAPDLLLDGFGPSELGNLMEISGHDSLSLNKFIMMQREVIDLSIQILLLDLSEFFAALGQQ